MNNKEWQKQISLIKSNSILGSFQFIRDIINSKKLFHNLENLILQKSKNKKVGILFSGGVDSTVIALICKKLDINFTCYTIGFYDEKIKFPEDIIYSRKIVKNNNFNYEEKVFSLSEVSIFIEKAIKLLSKNKIAYDVINIGVASVELAALSLAEQDNCNIVFTGLGAEEIFAGYKRHRTAKDVLSESWNGLTNMYINDLIREDLIQAITGIEIFAPFTNLKIIKLTMNISIKSKINKDQNKIILRKFARKIGLKHFSERKKLAAQYGSRINKAIYHLAKKNGFKTRTEFVNSFIDSKQKINKHN